jgi:hypothetical protein
MMGTAMRYILLTTAMMLALTGGFAHAASTNDEVFANAALRELHKLVIASAQSERAAKDNDRIGCRDAYDNLQKAAHEALTNMHQMSFAPIGALEDVSHLLRVSNLTQNGCPDDAMIRLSNLPLIAGQAIIGLRTDYAIGDADWYMVNTSGDVEAKNPLRYAQSLSDQNYSWVHVRPRGMFIFGVSDWKAEMASHEVGDPAIENSGNNLKIIEVDYRKNYGDDNTYVSFYRTKEDAQAAAQASKARTESDAKVAAELKASSAKWSQKFTSLPYMVASHDAGFKLAYAVCKPAGKDAKGFDNCNDDDSHDWSDSRTVPYRWFSNISGCEDAAVKLNTEHPADVNVNPDDAFRTYNGHYHSHDLSAWVASNPPDVLAANLGLPITVAERFPRRGSLSHDLQMHDDKPLPDWVEQSNPISTYRIPRWVKLRRTRCEQMFSASPSNSDIR